MIRRFYAYLIALSATRWALPALAAVAFSESAFFPVPPDVLLAPMVLARRERAWLYAGVCSLASVLGALLGYAIGLWASPLAEGLFKLFGHPGGLVAYAAWFKDNGFAVILLKGLTPIPFKLVTIASGAARFNLALFLLACAITRSGRFFIEAALLQHPQAKAFVDRYLLWLLGAAFIALLGAIVLVKLL